LEKKQNNACPLKPGSFEEKTSLDSVYTGLMNFFRSWKNVLPILLVASLALLYLNIYNQGTYAVAAIQASEGLSIVDEFPAWNRTFRQIYEVEGEYLYGNVETLDDLVISGEDVYLIENRTIILRGYILVKDQAQLIIRNAEIYNIKRGVSGGELVPYYANIYLQDDSSILLENTTLHGDYFIAVTLNNSTNAIITNSLINGDMIVFGESNTELINSQVYRLQVAQRAWISLRDSFVSCLLYREEVPLAGESVEASFWDAKFTEVIIEAWNTYFELISMPIRGCSSLEQIGEIVWGTQWSLKEFCPGSEVLDITVHECDYKYLTFRFKDSSASFSDVPRLGEISAYDSKISITDCSLRSLSITSSEATVSNSLITLTCIDDDSETSFSNTQIKLLALSNYTGRSIFEDAYVENLFIEGEMDGIIEGSITYGNDALNTLKTSDDITVSYTLVTQTPEYRIPEAAVSLFDNNGQKVWSGTTDENGTVTFQITYNQKEFDAKYLLQSSIHDHVCRSEVDITTVDYPIIHEFENLPKQNNFITNSIKVISLLIILGALALKKMATL